MKYTIELTTEERDIICDLIGAYRDNSLGEHSIPFKNTTLCKFDEESTDYSLAYNKALKDVNHVMAVINAMSGAERAELFEGHFDIARIFCEFTVEHIVKIIKAYEEKKKAAEEIKVGDEVKSVCTNLYGVVTKVNHDTEKIRILFCDGSASMIECFSEDYEKTGRHFEEIEQLLDKLRGENND